MPLEAWPPYQGWPNRPTWDVFTTLTDEETRQPLEALAPDAFRLRQWLEEHVQRFLKGQETPRPVELLLTHWATDPARRIDWSRVAAAQREGADCSLTPLEAAAGEALRPIEQGLPSDPSLSLALWWDGLARRWAEQPELRLRPSPLGALARCIIDSSLQAIDWQRLAQALRGE
ncbi:hypothetical protein [Thermogemmatispora tikiterensis]|uniref:Uncharacterized protein n=1 Tax=Thermogemmatispora tikiterensis TaxID=1825093 RepID=A0A328VJZ0_9CHLR|nr:hypothetical protein [Thermogemmatispora tikiterensis]RAQ95923.1 hypothetical protein A4R35_10285 [Thermogemmatispora tikiterensis]